MSSVSHARVACQPARKSVRPASGTCRLVLTIQTGSTRTTYRVKPVPITGAVATKLLRLTKPNGDHYTVASTLDGLSCECADYTFNREGTDPAGCKHIRSLVACGLLESRNGRKGGAR